MRESLDIKTSINGDTIGKFAVMNPDALVRVGIDKLEQSKSLDERLQGLKNVYDSASDFDFITILNLEDEYNTITKDTPDHTTKRNEILNMRRKLIDRLTWKHR